MSLCSVVRRRGSVPAVLAMLMPSAWIGRAEPPAIAPAKAAVIAAATVSVDPGDGRGRPRGGGGYRTTISSSAAGADVPAVPLVVVGGTPSEMGWHLGRLLQKEIRAFLPGLLEKVEADTGLSETALVAAWHRSAAFTDDRFEQELLGLADGSGVPLGKFQAAHALPLLMPFSCSSIAAWGNATADGHLYQTRNLDWSLALAAHEFPAVVLYLPRTGQAHLVPTFAGYAGANCGLSTAGIALAEMGYSRPEEMPYDLDAPHFTSWFRTILADARGLGEALEIFRGLPATKRYHFVFGDGRRDRRAVKIRAAATASAVEIDVWGADDPGDPLAPQVLADVVYEDEGRGIFPFLKRHHGSLDGPRLVEAACTIPIKGANVLDVVFDATALRAWISYAGAGREAYERPFVFLDLAALDGDGDGRPDIVEGSGDADGDGLPDFLPPTAAAGEP
jgi:isopenicillin-N N-acyltransferase-like protein